MHKFHHGLFTNACQRRVRVRCSAAANPSSFPQKLSADESAASTLNCVCVCFHSQAKSTRPLRHSVDPFITGSLMRVISTQYSRAAQVAGGNGCTAAPDAAALWLRGFQHSVGKNFATSVRWGETGRVLKEQLSISC